MDFDHQAVGTGCYSGFGQVGYHPALARSVAGIDDDRQVALAFDGQDGAQVEGVAGVCFKSTDAPFAEDDVVVAFSHDVFCRHEPFFDGRAQAPLEEDRLVRLADGFEEVEVLHVPGPDLDDVDAIFEEDRQFIGRHDFRNDREFSFAAGIAEHIQAFIA